MSVVKIENNTDQLIFLPPVLGIEVPKVDPETGEDIEPELVDFPSGVKLQGGLNSVPKMYMDALFNERRRMCGKLGEPRLDKKGQPLYRYPGREALSMLTAPVTYTTANGSKYGPRVTVFQDAQVGREDGPKAPATLPSNANAALTIISVTSERTALERWNKATRDANIKVAIASRLAALKSGG